MLMVAIGRGFVVFPFQFCKKSEKYRRVRGTNMNEDIRYVNNRYRKLHLVVSEQLFQKIIEHGQLQDIDSLVGNLLSDYFDGKEVE